MITMMITEASTAASFPSQVVVPIVVVIIVIKRTQEDKKKDQHDKLKKRKFADGVFCRRSKLYFVQWIFIFPARKSTKMI